MKNLILALLFISSPAFASDLEVSIGLTQFKQSDNGTWYQNGLPHQLDMRSLSSSIGLTGWISSSIRWRAGIQYLGHSSFSSLDVSDADFAKYGGVYRPQMWTHHGKGHTSQIYLTFDPQTKINGLTVFMELGAAVYETNFSDRITYLGCNTWSANVNHNPNLRLSAIIGGGLIFGRSSIAFTAENVGARGANSGSGNIYPSIASGPLLNISLRHTF